MTSQCFFTFSLAPVQPALNISAPVILRCHSDHVISLSKVLPGILTALRTNFKLTITSEVWKYTKTKQITKIRLFILNSLHSMGISHHYLPLGRDSNRRRSGKMIMEKGKASVPHGRLWAQGSYWQSNWKGGTLCSCVRVHTWHSPVGPK